ncbi:MAG: hypothetical protein Q7Q71_03260 [Verrucomicrobiota bacterium JB023]|nr:hypothetical protein [Verrucomicrobiota bacterium JB023]
MLEQAVFFVLAALLATLLVSGMGRWHRYQLEKTWTRWLAKRRLVDGQRACSKEATAPEIVFVEDGFQIRFGIKAEQPAYHCLWSEVLEAIAYKQDLMTMDCVCIQFRSREGTMITVDEEMKGWGKLIDSLPDFLPGALPIEKWYRSLTAEAFELAPTILYRRAVNAGDSSGEISSSNI